MYPIPADASATVQRPPPGRRTAPRIQPFKRVADPDFVLRTCLTLSSAFRQIYAGNAADLNFESLYRCTYNVCIGHGDEVLYTQVATTMAAEVEKLAGSLENTASAPDDEFLQELLGRWKKHSNAVTMIRDVVMYMERSFVEFRHKAPVPELGLRAWRDGMLCPDGEVVVMTIEMFGMMPKRKAIGYTKPYPNEYELIPLPPKYRLPDFTKFTDRWFQLHRACEPIFGAAGHDLSATRLAREVLLNPQIGFAIASPPNKKA
ncbi:hypothetical protein QYE76_046676 [Lolium multiflorum]|uniref:Cullin N-terminal domain-containing protein n=1 Tax=Lolium multiflorum TaxID=4521 RepID=A0AAD8TPY2_LOLMU|nr:hypothetical protein QYE76_046676 [Lolium multiflorum]